MGLGKLLAILAIKALGFIAGYAYCKYATTDERYDIQRYHGAPYLVDLEQKQRLEITEDTFQVGSLEHRVTGILNDPRLARVLDDLPYAR